MKLLNTLIVSACLIGTAAVADNSITIPSTAWPGLDVQSDPPAGYVSTGDTVTFGSKSYEVFAGHMLIDDSKTGFDFVAVPAQD